MAAMSTKQTFTLQFTGSEAEHTMRKIVFAAAVGIQDATLSNLAQPLVRIALKLIQLLRTHRAAHVGPGVYDPPDDDAHNQWMANEQDLVDATAELETELTTHYVKDKIDATTGAGSAANVPKRAYKRLMLLQKVNSIVGMGCCRQFEGRPFSVIWRTKST
jgi:hypothetical protein